MREIVGGPGRFVWHELVTSDVEASRRFYGELFSWQIETVADGPLAYRYLSCDGEHLGGLVLRPGPHIPPHVLSYVSVRELGPAIDRAREHRAAVLVPAMDRPFGRAAVLQDPQGAVFGLCRAPDGDSPATLRPRSGVFSWNQLNSSDAERAASFYASVLPWARAQGPREGLSAFTRDEQSIAGLRQAPQGTFAHWLSFVGVDDLPRARSHAIELGATILVETVSLPDVGVLSVIQDNVGAIIGLLERMR